MRLFERMLASHKLGVLNGFCAARWMRWCNDFGLLIFCKFDSTHFKPNFQIVQYLDQMVAPWMANLQHPMPFVAFSVVSAALTSIHLYPEKNPNWNTSIVIVHQIWTENIPFNFCCSSNWIWLICAWVCSDNSAIGLEQSIFCTSMSGSVPSSFRHQISFVFSSEETKKVWKIIRKPKEYFSEIGWI